MPRVSGDIPSFINGISQQSASVRLPTQGQAQTNFYSTLVGGMKKRPPTEVVCRIAESVPANASFHIIDRDSVERYIAVFTPTSVQVFDFQGNARTVSAPNGFGYLASPDLRFLTVADYTMVVNRNVTVAMAGTTSAVRPREAIVNIQSGNYGRTYQIFVNGSLVAEYSTPDGSAASQSPQIATTVIAAELYNDLVANLGNSGAPWAIGIHQNAIHIINYSSNFSIIGQDGVNGNAMKVSKDRISRFSDLPQYGPDGFVIEITSSSGTEFDNYWVRADKGGTNNNSVITWRETLKPGTVLGMNAATMPHTLRKNGDGSFTFAQLTWDNRKAGDTVISPNPSFVGQKINDVFFHRNRLGLLADENVILSRAGSFFDFFRTTATTLLDDDPIDIAASHIKVSFLKAAVPVSESLFLFSERSQFRLSGNDLLTAKTANIKPVAEYSTTSNVRPIAVGNNIFFANADASTTYASLFEMTFDKRTEQVMSAEVTAHVPNYIPSGVNQIEGTVDESVLAIRTAGAPSSLYIYRYFWNGEEKVQSSFSQWTFPGAIVRSCIFCESELFLLMQRDGRLVLEKVRMDTAARDPNITFLVNLDCRTQATGGTYDSVNNRTPFNIPFVNTSQPLQAVMMTGNRRLTGQTVTIGPREANLSWTVYIAGNHQGSLAYFGTPYTARYDFSQLFYRVPAGQSVRSLMDGRLQVLNIAIAYQDTSYFKVRVAYPDREERVTEYTGNFLRDGLAVLGEIPTNSDTFTMSVESDSRRVQIALENDSWQPVSFLSASWRGIWNPNNRNT
jgi:hypothetical protein